MDKNLSEEATACTGYQPVLVTQQFPHRMGTKKEATPVLVAHQVPHS
jgi:hypothetical protein